MTVIATVAAGPVWVLGELGQVTQLQRLAAGIEPFDRIDPAACRLAPAEVAAMAAAVGSLRSLVAGIATSAWAVADENGVLVRRELVLGPDAVVAEVGDAWVRVRAGVGFVLDVDGVETEVARACVDARGTATIVTPAGTKVTVTGDAARAVQQVAPGMSEWHVVTVPASVVFEPMLDALETAAESARQRGSELVLEDVGDPVL